MIWLTWPRTISVNALIASLKACSFLEWAKDARLGVPEAFPLSRTRSKDGLLPGTAGDRGPKEWSRAAPRVAPVRPDRGIDRPRSGEPEAPTSWRLARRRPRQLCAGTAQRRVLRSGMPAHHRLARTRPRDSVGCCGVTTRAPRVSRRVLREVRQPCCELGREEGACKSDGGFPPRCASAPQIARSARCPRANPGRRPAIPAGPLRRS